MAFATATLTNGQALTFRGSGPVQFSIEGTFTGTVDIRERLDASTVKVLESHTAPTTAVKRINAAGGGREFSALVTLSSGSATVTFWD